MPPKPTGADADKKKTAPKKVAVPTDPDEFDAMTEEQLQDELKKSVQRLNELRRSRNYYQLERDQLHQYYTVVQEEVGKTKAHVHNIEAQMERLQDTHQNHIRLYLQRVVHLEYEHANNVDAIKAVSEKERAEEENARLRKKALLQKLKLQLRSELEKEELQYEEEIRNLRDIERKEVAKLRERFEKNQQQLKEQYDASLKQQKEDLLLQTKVELHSIEERRNSHINMLIWNHEAKFEEMRAYYNAVTRDNLKLIDSLHQRIAELREKQRANEQTVDELDHKNQLIQAPLREVEARLKVLNQRLHSYKKDQFSLRHTRARKSALTKQINASMDTHRQLSSELREVQRQRDALYATFEDIVLSVQAQANTKNDALEHMLNDLQDQYRVKNAQFGAVLRASNLDPVVLQNVTRKLDDVLTAKNEQIDELRYEVAKVTKAHNDLVRIYETKLAALGIPKGELNIEPTIGLANTVPANLVMS